MPVTDLNTRRPWRQPRARISRAEGSGACIQANSSSPRCWIIFPSIPSAVVSNATAATNKIKRFTCHDQFLCMAFAQLTYRESLRDIEACLRAQRNKLYHMGIRGSGLAQHAGRCQRAARLAHLRRLRPSADPDCTPALCRRGLRRRSRQHRLRTRCHDHRSVPVALSLGAVPPHQGGGEAAYPARPARQHPDLHPHLRRQAPRRQRPRIC